MTADFPPPQGHQCDDNETYVDPGGGAGCVAQISFIGPPSPDPGVPGVGPSTLCWFMPGDPAFEPQPTLTSGNCDEDNGCSTRIVMGLKIKPVDPDDPNHSKEEYYDYWHGDGTWAARTAWQPGDPPLPRDPGPTWDTVTDDGTVIWGAPSQQPLVPDGFSEIYIDVSLSTDKCGQGAFETIIVRPAGDPVHGGMILKIFLECTKC